MTASAGLADAGPVVLIGAGKMGFALARGWLKAGLPPGGLVLVDPDPQEPTRSFARASGVRLLPSPLGVLTHVLVLAVKPQIIERVMGELRPVVGRQTLVISIAAGIPLASLAQGLGTDRIVRTMPNTPAQLGLGVTGAVPGPGVSEADRAVADTLLRAAGKVLWFDDEARIDAITAVSGSGPAYVFHLVEALADAAMRQGFNETDAMMLARETVLGSAALLAEDPAPASVLRQNVTSPNGTTAAALAVLMGPNGLADLMDRAVSAARRRSEELGRS